MVQRTRHKNSARSGLVTAVDVGSTKIACFIGQPLDNGGVEIVGIGHQLARGMRNGNIVDMDAVEHSIRTAVESAEQLAGENVSNVTVCISGGVPDSKLISFDISISGHEIGDADLKRALDPTWLHAQQSADRQVIHTLPVGYSIDGNRGVRDPRGMFGEKLGGGRRDGEAGILHSPVSSGSRVICDCPLCGWAVVLGAGRERPGRHLH